MRPPATAPMRVFGGSHSVTHATPNCLPFLLKSSAILLAFIADSACREADEL